MTQLLLQWCHIMMVICKFICSSRFFLFMNVLFNPSSTDTHWVYKMSMNAIVDVCVLVDVVDTLRPGTDEVKSS